jgi:hypothetical protein
MTRTNLQPVQLQAQQVISTGYKHVLRIVYLILCEKQHCSEPICINLPAESLAHVRTYVGTYHHYFSFHIFVK